MAKKKTTVKKSKTNTAKSSNNDNTLAIVGLILNILILPGLGTIVGGGESLRKTGITQLVLALVSIPLMFIIVGIPMMIAVWIWGIVTGIKMVQQ